MSSPSEQKQQKHNHVDQELSIPSQEQHEQYGNQAFQLRDSDIQTIQGQRDNLGSHQGGIGFAEENVFSYDTDIRQRASLKSQSDHELEDISGYADMVDVVKEDEPSSLSDIKIQNQQQTLPMQIKTQNQQIQIENGKEKDKVFSEQSQSKLQKKQDKQATQSIQKVQPQQIVIESQNFTSNINSNQSKVQKSEQKSQQQKTIQTIKQVAQIKKSKQTTNNNSQTEDSKINESFQKPNIKLIYQKQIENKNSQTKYKEEEKKQKQQKSRLSFVKQNFSFFDKKQEIKQVNKNEPQKKYHQELEDDLAHLKKSVKNHQKTNKLFSTSDKDRKSQKVNKTHMPISNKLYMANQSQQIKSQELRMLLKISFQKKKENYQMLKQWDKRRAQNMGLHRNMIDLLQSEVDKRIKASLQNFDIYVSFFREKLKQEQKFVSSPVVNTKYALQNNSISKNIYINCSVILNSLSEENAARTKKVQDFIVLIKQNILKDLTQQHLHQSQRQLLKVRQKISSLKSSLKKYNTQTQQKSEALASFFSQNASNVSIKSQHDFYSVQLQFLRSASQQILIQKRLGENCLEYYHTALSQEIKRAGVIKEAMLTYAKGIKQTYGIEMEEVQMEQMSKGQQVSLINQFYSLDDMFDQRSRQVFKTKFNISQESDMTVQSFTNYVNSFSYQNFSSRMLLLKQFQAKYFLTASKQSKPRQQTCFMVITVDFYIHLFFSSERTGINNNSNPDVTFKISAKQLQIRDHKDQFIDIVKKQEKRASMISYFWESKNQKVYRVKFNNKDAKQQFGDYVRKLMY